MDLLQWRDPDVFPWNWARPNDITTWFQGNVPWTAAANGDIVRTVIDLFGAGRCMFASNFPVDSLCAPFPTIFGGFREIVRDLSMEEQRALFRDNALRIYAMS